MLKKNTILFYKAPGSCVLVAEPAEPLHEVTALAGALPGVTVFGGLSLDMPIMSLESSTKHCSDGVLFKLDSTQGCEN